MLSTEKPKCMEDIAMIAIRDSREILTVRTIETTAEEHEAADEAFRAAHPWNHVVSIHTTYV